VAEQVIAGAERIVAREKSLVDAINAGEPVTSALGTGYETMLDAEA